MQSLNFLKERRRSLETAPSIEIVFQLLFFSSKFWILDAESGMAFAERFSRLHEEAFPFKIFLAKLKRKSKLLPVKTKQEAKS